MTDRQGVSFHSPPGGQLSAAVDSCQPRAQNGAPAAYREKDVVTALKAAGYDLVTSTPEELASFNKQQIVAIKKTLRKESCQRDL